MNVSFEAPNLDYEAAIRFTNQTYDRNFSYPSFAITLRRKASRYFYTKILPTGMLVAISWVNRCHQMSFPNFLTAVDKFHSLQISFLIPPDKIPGINTLTMPFYEHDLLKGFRLPEEKHVKKNLHD